MGININTIPCMNFFNIVYKYLNFEFKILNYSTCFISIYLSLLSFLIYFKECLFFFFFLQFFGFNFLNDITLFKVIRLNDTLILLKLVIQIYYTLCIFNLKSRDFEVYCLLSNSVYQVKTGEINSNGGTNFSSENERWRELKIG